VKLGLGGAKGGEGLIGRGVGEGFGGDFEQGVGGHRVHPKVVIGEAGLKRGDAGISIGRTGVKRGESHLGT
jgi:hypothetical protein